MVRETQESRDWSKREATLIREKATTQERIRDYRNRIAERDRAVAETVGLRVALAPFAAAANDCLDEDDADKSDTWEHSIGMALTIGDFRRAQRALADHPGDKLLARMAEKDAALQKMLGVTQSMIKGEISPYKLEEAEAAGTRALTGDGSAMLAVVEAARAKAVLQKLPPRQKARGKTRGEDTSG